MAAERQRKKSQLDSTLVTLTKKQFVIELKRNNPTLTLREISKLAGASYGYARHVWADYVRREITKKGRVSGVPFSVHGWFYRDRLRGKEYGLCPVRPRGRNGVKVWRGCRVVYLIHKGGDVFVYPLFDGWDQELKSWLSKWLDPEFADLHLETLKGNMQGRKSYAAHTPGQIPKLRFNLKGVGRFITDPTPWPDGTTEVEVDPFIAKQLGERLDHIDKQLQSVNYAIYRLTEQVESLAGELHSLVGLLKGCTSQPVTRVPLSNRDRFVV